MLNERTLCGNEWMTYAHVKQLENKLNFSKWATSRYNKSSNEEAKEKISYILKKSFLYTGRDLRKSQSQDCWTRSMTKI